MELVDSYPNLLERLTTGEEEDVIHVGELVSIEILKRSTHGHLLVDWQRSLQCARRRHKNPQIRCARMAYAQRPATYTASLPKHQI